MGIALPTIEAAANSSSESRDRPVSKHQTFFFFFIIIIITQFFPHPITYDE
jgi:hypothetical protein